VEAAVFQRENMEYVTGEYETFLYGDEDEGEVTMRVSMECQDIDHCEEELVKENFIKSFFKYKPILAEAYFEDILNLIFNFTKPGELEFYKIKGRPKRIVDRR